MRRLTPLELDTIGDQIAFKFMGEAGEEYEAYLTTVDAVTLMSSLPGLIERAVSSPDARSPQMLRTNRLQIVERGETIWLRISIADHGIFYDYAIPKNTTLAEELKLLADRVAARREAKITNSRSDIPSRRH
jgi:hypothetical protein